MKLTTSLEKAQYLLKASEISVDVETDTDDSHHDFGTKVGLSYIADITWLSLWDGDPKHPVVTFKMLQDDHEEKAAFVREVLSRPGITIIAHNAVFDLRSLGGHYGFTIPLETDVWDTQSIALLLLMSNNARSGFALEVFEEKLGLLTPDDLAFSKVMKPMRDKLHLLPDDDLKRYVSLDTISGYRLYKFQQRLIELTDETELQPRYTGDFELVTVKGRDFLASKHYAHLKLLVHKELRISRWCANVAIRGVRIDSGLRAQAPGHDDGRLSRCG